MFRSPWRWLWLWGAVGMGCLRPMPSPRAPLLSPSPPPQRYKVGVSLANGSSPLQGLLASALQEEAQRHPEVEMVLRDARGQEAQQAADVQALLDMGVRALLLVPQDSPSLREVVAKARAQGVHVMTLHQRLPEVEVSCHLESSAEAEGRSAALFLAMQLGPQGQVAEILEAEDPLALERSQGFHQALGEKAPGLRVVYQEWGSGEEAKALARDALQAFPNLGGFFAHSDALGMAIVQGLKEASLPPKVVVSIGGSPEALGMVTASLAKPLGAQEALQAALALLQGQSVPKELLLEPSVMTSPR